MQAYERNLFGNQAGLQLRTKLRLKAIALQPSPADTETASIAFNRRRLRIRHHDKLSATVNLKPYSKEYDKASKHYRQDAYRNRMQTIQKMKLLSILVWQTDNNNLLMHSIPYINTAIRLDFGKESLLCPEGTRQ